MDKYLIKKKKDCKVNDHSQLSNFMKDNKRSLLKKEAKTKIQKAIFLNAWRRQREKNIELQNNIRNLSAQNENLQLQAYALRQLLDSEKLRVVQAKNDFRIMLNALEECNYEKKTLANEKELLECQLHTMEEQMAIIENECRNQKNDLINARLEAQNWEKQLEKERDKLSKMRDDKKFVIDEVQFKGNLLVWQIRSFEQFSQLHNILQSKSNIPALPWDDTFGRNHPPVPEISRVLKMPKKQQTIIIVEKPPETPELRALLAKVERKIVDEDGRLQEYRKTEPKLRIL